MSLYAAFDRLDKNARLAIAYSGGGDSTPLLHVAAARVPAACLRALHVQHDLCDQAADWAAHCQAQAAALGVSIKVLPVQTARYGAEGPEAAARRARYAALAAELGDGEWLATAHHLRDQAETFLLQALRGAGVAGLAAMPEFAPLGAGWLWRPWRDQDFETIAAYADEHGLKCLADPANSDRELARGRLRAAVRPALDAAFPGADKTLARSARLAAQAAEAVTALAANDLAGVRLDRARLSTARLSSLSPPRRAAVLRHWLAELGLCTPASAHVEQFERLLEARAHAGPRLGFCGTELRFFADAVYAMPRLGPPPTQTLAWTTPQTIQLPGETGWLGLRKGCAGEVALGVSFRRGGERLAWADGPGKRLSAWLYDRGWPPWLRERVPLVYAGTELIAVADAWHHPHIERWLGPDFNGFSWCHSLVGDPRGAPKPVVAPAPIR